MVHDNREIEETPTEEWPLHKDGYVDFGRDDYMPVELPEHLKKYITPELDAIIDEHLKEDGLL